MTNLILIRRNTMFTEIGIENFKAFGKMQRIPLKPITLLYGPNSSGKSSLMQALLLFKQTMEEGNAETVLLPKGGLLELGGVYDFLHKHNIKKELKISFSFKHLWHDAHMYYDLPKHDELKMEFTFSPDHKNQAKTQLIVKEIKLFHELEPKPLVKCKNVWFLPELNRLFVKKANTAKENDEDKDLTLKWISDIKRSLLIIESINLKSKLIKDQWKFFERRNKKQSYEGDCLESVRMLEERLHNDIQAIKNMESNKEDQERFSNLIREYIEKGNYPHKILEILKDRKIYEILNLPDVKQKEIIRNQKQMEYSPGPSILLFEALFGEMPSESPIMSVPERKKVEQSIFFLKTLRTSLTNKNYSLFSNLKDVPFNKLITLDKCFPGNLAEADDWIFQNILAFEAHGKSFIKQTVANQIVINDYIVKVTDLLRKYLRKINYIGPLREYPARSYSFSGNVLSKVGKTGENVPDILYGRPHTVNIINKWLEIFEIDYKIEEVKSIKNDLFEVSLYDNMTKCVVGSKDVGFGISQILPILVQSVVSEHDVICIEQPEIHIHPRLQAELGSFIAACAAKWHDVKGTNDEKTVIEEPGNQFIIETHSENLILRLQKLIRKGELKKEDVAVIYFDKTPNGTVATELRLNDNGEFIDPWPQGFFEESFKEMFGD